MSTNKQNRIQRVSTPNVGMFEKALCAVAQRVEKWARAHGFQSPGISGRTPAPGGWWYRMDLRVPFTKTTLGFISGESRAWRISNRVGGPWRYL